LSYYFNEINAVHPFREGNGRTLRAFSFLLVKQAGYQVDWQQIDKEAYTKANIAGFQGNYGPMTELLKEITIPFNYEHQQKKFRQGAMDSRTKQPLSNLQSEIYQTEWNKLVDIAQYIKVDWLLKYRELSLEKQRELKKIESTFKKRIEEAVKDKKIFEKIQQVSPQLAKLFKEFVRVKEKGRGKDKTRSRGRDR